MSENGVSGRGAAGAGGGGGETLFAAIKAGDEAAAAAAIDADPASLGARSENGESPLLLAAYYRRGRIARLLLARGAPVDLFEACAVGETAAAEERLEREPGFIDAIAPDGFTPLTLASYFGHDELARRLIARGASLELKSQNAMAVAPIHAAVAGRNGAIVRLLLQAGADPSAVTHGGWRPVAEAAVHGDLEILKDLLDHGADPNPRNDEGKTALALAEEKGHTEVAAVLRALGAS